MHSTLAASGSVQLATDTGQNGMVALGTILLGLLALITICAYLFPAFVARGGFRAPTLAGTLRDVAVVCVTIALAVYLFGVMCYLRMENEWYTCGPQRLGYTSAPGGPDLLLMDESLFPVRSVCRWSDGYTYDFVPGFVNPVIFGLLVLAVVAAGAALGIAGAKRDLARRG